MSIEVGSIIVDTITAMSAVVGVIIAARLGQKAVRVARETVDRAERDYASSRVDAAGDAYANVIQAMANVKADLHIFWKGDLDELKASSADPQRIAVLEDRNDGVEVEVHRDVYLLEGACVRLSRAVGAISLNHNSVQIPNPAAVDRANAAIGLYYGSAFPHYLSVLSDDKKKIPLPLRQEVSFINWFLAQLSLDTSNPLGKELEVKAAEWITEYLQTEDPSQSTAETIAINFISGFARRELSAALDAITDPVMEVCRPVIVDHHSSNLI